MKLRKLLKKTATLIAAVSLCIGLTGCTGHGGENGSLESVSSNENGTGGASRAYQPVKREDGRKFKMAFVDQDPYQEIFKMMYYVIESLKADGWISYDSMPFDPQTDTDTLAMMNCSTPPSPARRK